jgi:excisionase family DNA binding protein
MKALKEYPEVMTVREVAEYLRCSAQKVYNMVQANELPATKVGGSIRFKRDKLAEILE